MDETNQATSTVADIPAWRRRLAHIDVAHIRKTVKLLGPLADLLGVVSKTPAGRNLALALRGATFVAAVLEEWAPPPIDTWSYFRSEKWVAVPRALWPIITPSVSEVTRVGGSDNDLVFHATVAGQARIGWRSSGRTSGGLFEGALGVFVHSEDVRRLMALAADVMWQGIPQYQAMMTMDGIAADQRAIDAAGLSAAPFERALQDRVSAFLAAGHNRAYLIDGPPGTGKSTAVTRVATRTGLRTLRVPVEYISDATSQEHFHGCAAISRLVSMLAPEIVIIHDLDRVPQQYQQNLLDLLEDLRRHTRVVFVTVNNRNALPAAVQRVARLDDHLVMPPLEEEFVRQLLGEHVEFLPAVRLWPVAYIADLLTRVETLGLEAARAELPDLAARVQEAQKQYEAAREPPPELPQRNLIRVEDPLSGTVEYL